MPVPSTAVDISTTASSNSPAGTDLIGNTLDEYLRATQAILKQQMSQGADLASASTLALLADGNTFDVTGTTTITAISSTYSWNGRIVFLKFDSALTLTHNATTLILPGGGNITTAAGDLAVFRQDAPGEWRCIDYQYAKGPGEQIQKQTYTRFTTGGTSTAYTLTPVPALSANTAGARFRVVFNAAAGTAPTLAVSGLTALPLKYYDQTGTLRNVTSDQIPINWASDVESDGTNWVVLEVSKEIRSAFNANRGSSQSIPNNSITKVQYNNSTFDYGSNYDATTNYTFTAPVNGIYCFTHVIGFSTGVDQATYQVLLYKNNALARTVQHRFSGTGGEGFGITANIDLVAGDFVDARVFQLTGGAIDLNTTSYFSGFLAAV